MGDRSHLKRNEWEKIFYDEIWVEYGHDQEGSLISSRDCQEWNGESNNLFIFNI